MRLSLAVRLGVAASLAFWLGGLLFYASVVIPIGSHTLAGFITRRVASAINVAGALSILLLLANLVRARRATSARARRILGVTWLVVALAQVALFVLRPVLDAYLDPLTRTVADPKAFYALHRVYLLMTTTQIIAAFVHVASVLDAWRAEDRAACSAV